MFAIFDGDSYLYIINLKNNIVRKVKFKWSKKKYTSPDIKNIKYYKLDKIEHLLISFKAEEKNTQKVINQLIHGIIV